mmetsp:Transcript_44442/g.50211  ORF Transcript_44442/g.50211 Transcript_44442/m.50211 type:complete len:372 (-) Transcript_44442:217-1332(-)
MPPFAQHAPIGCDDNSSLFVKQHENGKAGKSITASGVWDEVTYSSEGPSFFDRFFDLNLCCSFDDQAGNNNNKQVEEGNTESVVVEQNFTTDMQRYQSQVNREQKIEILKAIQRMKSPIKEAEEAVNHRRREAAAEQYVYMKPSDDATTLPTKNNDSWQEFDTPFSNQHDGNNRINEDKRAQILKNNSRVNSTKGRSVTKERDIKRMKGPNQFKKVQNNRTPHDVSSNQKNEKETSMMKRIKKSLSTKKVNSNSRILENDLTSSTRTTKRTNRSLSLKKFKSIHHKGETTAPPSSNKKRKSRMAERKKVSSSKNQTDTETRQDVEGAVSSSPEKRLSFTKRLSKSFSTKNKDTGTGNNSVEEVIVDWSQKL